MPRDISADGIVEKNAVATAGAWIWLVKLEVASTTIRICSNNENVAWPYTGSGTGLEHDADFPGSTGNTWTAYPLELGQRTDSSAGEIQQFKLRVANVAHLLDTYLHTNAGCIGNTVTLYLVNSKHLDETDAEIEVASQILSATTGPYWVELTLGFPHPLRRSFPPDRYSTRMCRHLFRGINCAYTGASVTGLTRFGSPYSAQTIQLASSAAELCVGMFINVSGSDSNDGNYKVASNAGANILVVTTDYTLTNEETAGVTVKAVCVKTLDYCTNIMENEDAFGGSPASEAG